MNASPRAAGAFKNPHIKMELPGPKSRAMIERDSKVASPSYPRDYPFVISHAQGHGSLGRGRQPLPRFRGRHRGLRDGPRPPARREGGAGRGRQVPAHLERLLARGDDGARRAPLRDRAARRAGHVLLLPVRHGIRGRRAEARALRDEARPHHRLPRQLPRPHDGLALADVQQVHAAGGLLPDHAGRDARALPEHVPPALCRQRPGQGGARLHPHAVRAERPGLGSRRDRDRAAAGRRRLSRAAGRIPRRACARSATRTESCSCSTKCSRASAARGRCSRPSIPASRPTS